MFTPFAFVKSAVTPSPIAIGILDVYPSASMAYSVRKLRTAYAGNCLRVRRSSDDATQNIGFDVNGDLDTAAITSFVGANNGFVDTWYDQSGNAKDATQATQAKQPQIVSSGTIITTGTRTSMDVTGDVMTFTATTVGRYSQVLVGKKVSSSSDRLIGFSGGSGTPPILEHTNGGRFYFQWDGSYLESNVATLSTDYEVVIGSTTSTTTATMARNNSTIASTRFAFAIGTSVDQIFQYVTNPSTANVQELILWQSEQDSNFTGIQTNINDYYSIY
jgi:hypothetical protein